MERVIASVLGVLAVLTLAALAQVTRDASPECAILACLAACLIAWITYEQWRD